MMIWILTTMKLLMTMKLKQMRKKKKVKKRKKNQCCVDRGEQSGEQECTPRINLGKIQK